MKARTILRPRRVVGVLGVLGLGSIGTATVVALTEPSFLSGIVLLAATSIVLLQGALLVAAHTAIAEARAARIEAARAARLDQHLTSLAQQQDLIAQAVRDQLRNDIRTRKLLEEFLNQPRA